jgi:hypothetical protein
MRISFWVFLLLVLLALGGYYGYTHWWSKQSRSHWVGGLHNAALQSDEELKKGKTAGALGSDEEDPKAPPPPKRDANGWIIK